MASIGHLAVGAAIGAVYSRRMGTRPRATIITFALLALAPDLDLASLLFGVAPNTPLYHRGLTHSVTFAVLAGILAGGAMRGAPPRRYLTGFFVFAAIASHGILDTMSGLGGGPMLLWPFTQALYEFPWRPIPGVLVAREYLTLRAIPTLVTETLLFLPFIIYAVVAFLPGTRVEKPPAAEILPSPE
jgi:inner membrane protein